MARSVVFRKCNKCSFYNPEKAMVCMNCKEKFVVLRRFDFYTKKEVDMYCKNPKCLPSKTRKALVTSDNEFYDYSFPGNWSFGYDESRESYTSAKENLLNKLIYFCFCCNTKTKVPRSDIIVDPPNQDNASLYRNFYVQWQCAACEHYTADIDNPTQKPTTFCSNCKLGRDPDDALIENIKKQQQLQQRREDEKYIRNLQEIEDVEAARLAGKVRGMKEMVKLLLEFTEEFDKRNMRFDEMALRSYLQATGVANAENNDLLNAAIQIAMSQHRR